MNTRNAIASSLLLALFPLVGSASQPAPQQGAARRDPAPAAAAAPALAGQLPVAADAARLLPLQGTVNARSFAGLQGRNGPIPAAAFVRTADLGKLSAADRDLLAKTGVALDIDLRTQEEESHSHDVLADDGRFAYRRISLLGREQIDMSKLPPSLDQLYMQWLDANQAQFRQVFQTIAAQQDGAVLFHCSAGKDRTGVVAALLQDLAGVARQDIVHNYAISAHYDAPMAEALAKRAGMAKLKANPNLAALSGTPPEAIEAFLDKLHGEYGGAASYLRTIGLNEAEVRSLLVRLGQEG